jgi:hypothetical protein
MSIWTKFRSITATSLLAAAVLAPAPANAELAVPKTNWPACDDFRVDFCIESVSIQPLGTKSALELTWYDSGTGPEAIVEEDTTVTGEELVVGPEVINPGEAGTFTFTLPADAPQEALSVQVTGPGLFSGDSSGAAGTTTLNMTLTTGIADQGSGTIAVFVDADGNGKFAAVERIALKTYQVGSPSEVGTGIDESVAGRATTGRWSHPKWNTYGLNAYGYDGLTIDFKTANAFTNHLFFTVYPVLADATNKTNIAARANDTTLAANLNMDDKITVKVRMNAIQTGVSIGIANNLTLNSITGTEDEPGSLTLTGTPVPVPQITNMNQCTGETSQASAVTNTMQGFIVVENDDMGFGVDGLSGRLSVASNGASCGISTPVWDDTTETLQWQAGAPHFEPDGVTPNKGFYKAIIPANDALLLWGLADPKKAVTALTISVINEAGGPAVAASKIAYLHGNIIIDVTGFNFSKPKIQIKKVASFGGFVKAKTIKCVDPVTKKTVTLTNAYGCPKAPEKPVQSFLTSKFAGAASSVTSTQKTEVKKMQAGFIEANKFICTGVYKTGASKAEQTLAKKRATAVCNYAKSQDKTLSYFAQAKPSKATSYIGKVMVTMKDQK